MQLQCQDMRSLSFQKSKQKSVIKIFTTMLSIINTQKKFIYAFY